MGVVLHGMFRCVLVWQLWKRPIRHVVLGTVRQLTKGQEGFCEARYVEVVFGRAVMVSYDLQRQRMDWSGLVRQ